MHVRKWLGSCEVIKLIKTKTCLQRLKTIFLKLDFMSKNFNAKKNYIPAESMNKMRKNHIRATKQGAHIKLGVFYEAFLHSLCQN
jgi:hypothetical protein